MPPRFLLLGPLAITLATGCISSKTGDLLDSAYEAAEAPLLESQRRAQTAEAPAKPDASELPSPGPHDSEADPLDAGPVDEASVVARAVAKSPALALMAHRARALVHAGRAEGSLPPAELGFEIWNLPLERPYSLNEADMYMVELRQRFPAAGSLDGRARAMAEEAQALLSDVATEERLVAQSAADAFADYAGAFAERRLQQRQVELLQRMRQVVQARLSTGGSGLGAFARLEVELARAHRALARVGGDITRSRATLNALLRRPATAALGEPRQGPAETVRLPVDELMVRAVANRGVLLSADARVRAAEARHAAAVAEARVPEFMAGLGYWQDPTMRPGLGLTTSMSLPWFWGPGRHRVAQTEEETAAERAARDGNLQGAEVEVAQAHASLGALEEQLGVITRQALPASRRSLEALAGALSTDTTSLIEWVDVSRSVLDLELEVALLKAELARTVASLERAVGTPLPRTPLALEEGP